MIYNFLIGIFGGSFNPIHLGHLHVARSALKLQSINLKKVFIMPAKQNPFKKNILQPSFEERLMGVDDFLKKHHINKHKILSSEFESISKHYETFFVLKDLQKIAKYSNKIKWMMGLDTCDKFYKWGGFYNFINEFDIIIISRGTAIEKIKILNSKTAKILKHKICFDIKHYKTGILYINTKYVNISSTSIRKNTTN